MLDRTGYHRDPEGPLAKRSLDLVGGAIELTNVLNAKENLLVEMGNEIVRLKEKVGGLQHLVEYSLLKGHVDPGTENPSEPDTKIADLMEPERAEGRSWYIRNPCCFCEHGCPDDRTKIKLVGCI